MRYRRGCCYKFRNCYGSAETDDDYWWKYFKVTFATQTEYCEFTAFEKDIYGNVRINRDHVVEDHFDHQDMIKITKGEWKNEFDKLKEYISAIP